jgi:hypothetical protein
MEKGAGSNGSLLCVCESDILKKNTKNRIRAEGVF